MSKIRLGVIFGGKSEEHEVSLRSAYSVMQAADKEKYDIVTIGITKEEGRWLLYEGPWDMIPTGEWQARAEADLQADPEHFGLVLVGNCGNLLAERIDFAMPVIHGPNCEDGTIQGMLELAGIPYGGSGVVGSATAMDKIVAKEIFADAGIPQTPYVALVRSQIGEEIEAKINAQLKYPLFVKPANMGSSVGITRVAAPEDLHAALLEAGKYDYRIVVEQGVDMRELEIAVMGNDELTCGRIGEILPGDVFYSYDAKYNDEGSLTVIDPVLPEGKAQEMQELAKKAYKALDCQGYARCDFMMEKSTGTLMINEINTLPGFTVISMFPMLMQASGLSYPRIIDEIIRLGFERFANRHPELQK